MIEDENALERKELTYFDILSSARAFFGFFSVVLCLNLWTYLDTTLAIKLERDFKLEPDITSLIYGI